MQGAAEILGTGNWGRRASGQLGLSLLPLILVVCSQTRKAPFQCGQLPIETPRLVLGARECSLLALEVATDSDVRLYGSEEWYSRQACCFEYIPFEPTRGYVHREKRHFFLVPAFSLLLGQEHDWIINRELKVIRRSSADLFVKTDCQLLGAVTFAATRGKGFSRNGNH
jgi:hypothetical protein